jgi:hypothetical protein
LIRDTDRAHLVGLTHASCGLNSQTSTPDKMRSTLNHFDIAAKPLMDEEFNLLLQAF